MVAAVAARGRSLLVTCRRTSVEHEGKQVKIPVTSRGAKFATCASLPFSLSLHKNLGGERKKNKKMRWHRCREGGDASQRCETHGRGPERRCGRWCWGREVTAVPVAPGEVGIYGAVKCGARRCRVGGGGWPGGGGSGGSSRGFWCDSGSGGDGVMVAAR